MKGIVVGLGKPPSTEGTEYFTGEQCVAELLEPLTPNSENWFVHFPGDQEENGQPCKRIRRLVRKL